MESDRIGIYIVGFSKLVGDLIDGFYVVMLFFGVLVVIVGLFVYFYMCCLCSILLLVGIVVVGVVWLFGLMELFGYELDFYFILVLFLIFVIGVFYGMQKMNGIFQDIGCGMYKYVVVCYIFCCLFFIGLIVLLCNIVGFVVLVIIDILVICDLVIIISIGVVVLIFIKLLLIFVVLFYIGVSKKVVWIVIEKDCVGEQNCSFFGYVWQGFDCFIECFWVIGVIVLLVGVIVVCSVVMFDFKIGDFDFGVLELCLDLCYNCDSVFIMVNYGLFSDQFVVIMKINEDSCCFYQLLQIMDWLVWQLCQIEGV